MQGLHRVWHHVRLSDALVCTDCEEGRITPLNLNADAEWVCGTCYASLPAETVNKALNENWDLIEETQKFDISYGSSS